MKKEEKIPHVREMALEMAIYQQLICSRIGWSEMNYCDFQLRAGCDFIDKILCQSEHADKQILRYSEVFWGWWKNQWHNRNLILYAGQMLDPNRYRLGHTTKVMECTFTINNFWEHIEAMHKDGCKRVYGEEMA